MNEGTLRAINHLSNARMHAGHANYCIKAAITELHKTGPHVEKAARLLRPLNQFVNGLHRLIKTIESSTPEAPCQ